jgi:DNA-binding protein YbaB
MVNPERDYASEAEVMKARLEKIKSDPERALFSDFKGISSSGAVTVRVDLLGRLKRVEFNRGTLYEGGEPWLMEEIMAAYRQAVQAANFLNFDLADLAKELDQAPALKARMDNAENERTRGRAAVDDRDDDTYYDKGGFLR